MAVDIRKGQGNVTLTREEFERRLRERFYDPEFEKVERQIADVIDVAWNAYDEYRKSPRTRKAGPGFADPEFELSDRMARDTRADSRGRSSARRRQPPRPRAASCAVRRGTIRPVRARCRRRSAWPRSRAKKSSTPASSATSST